MAFQFSRWDLSICFSALLAGVLAFGLLSGLQAQNLQNTDTQIRSRDLQSRALPDLGEETGEGDYEDDGEFGKLLKLQRASPWYVIPYASARGYWTSNVLLANTGTEGDTVFVETQGFNAGYRITPDWRVQLGYNYQLTRYEEKDFLDTDGHNPEFSSTYRLPWNFQLTGGFRGTWLNDPHNDVEIYREANPYGNLFQSHSFFEDRLTWFYGYQFDQKYANPHVFNRYEHTLSMGLTYVWSRQLVSQLAIRQNWQFFEFRAPSAFDAAREEWISTASLQTIWQPLPWMQVSAFAMGTHDNSRYAVRDYSVANLGGEVRFFWKF